MFAKTVGIIGSGDVARALGAGFVKKGWAVLLGSREPGKLKAWLDNEGRGARAGSFEDAAKFGELAVIAVKGSAAEAALRAAGPENLAGKVVIDTTNPISDDEPVDGVLRFFTGPNESLHERLQKVAPLADFVKAFNCVGARLMVDPSFADGRPTMFIAGDDELAKQRVAAIVSEFGFDVEDMGPAIAARALEPLAILWCIPGLRSDEWTHAFKLLKKPLGKTSWVDTGSAAQRVERARRLRRSRIRGARAAEPRRSLLEPPRRRR